MNNKILKVGLLVLVLVFPAFFFLVAHFTGENHFALPRLKVLGHVSDKKTGHISGDSVYHKISFPENINETSNLNLSDSTIKVVNLFFTDCNSVCPSMMSNLSKVYNSYKKDNEVQLISITIDLKTDSTFVLENYKKMLDVSDEQWQFTRLENDSIIEQFSKQELFLSVDTKKKTHSEKIVLIDKVGVIRGYFDGTNLSEVDELIAAIKILKQEYE